MPFISQGKTNWKFLLIIIVIAVIVGAGILALQYRWMEKGPIQNLSPIITLTSNPNETADWRVYRSGGEHGFEIKYPKDWMVNLGGPTLSFAPEVSTLPEDVRITMEIISDKSFPQMYSLEDPKEIYINNNKWYYKDDKVYNEDLKTAIRTRTYVLINPDSRIIVLQLVIRGGRQTRDYYLTDNEIANELKILNQMVSTYKFLEKIETPILCPQGFVYKEVTHPYRTKNNEVICVEDMATTICVRCGNKICDKNEDWCICPEDCPKPNLENL